MLKIFEHPEVDSVVFLKLVPGTSGDIALVIVDRKGRRVEGGILMDFHSDGTFSRRSWLNKDYGFQLKGTAIKERT